MAQQKVTIESVCLALLRKGQSPKEVLANVKKVFPNCQTSLKCIYYYSSKYKIGLVKSQEVNQEALKALGI